MDLLTAESAPESSSKANFACSISAYPSASVINIASIYAELGPDWSLYKGLEMSNPAAYSVSKGGLVQLTRWLSTTLSPSIRVIAISPGGIYRNQPSEFVKKYIKKHLSEEWQMKMT